MDKLAGFMMAAVLLPTILAGVAMFFTPTKERAPRRIR